MSLGLIVVMGAFIKVCAVHTPSHNPHKPKHRQLTLPRTLTRRRRQGQGNSGGGGGGGGARSVPERSNANSARSVPERSGRGARSAASNGGRSGGNKPATSQAPPPQGSQVRLS